jgi:hypothetical protein
MLPGELAAAGDAEPRWIVVGARDSGRLRFAESLARSFGEVRRSAHDSPRARRRRLEPRCER